MLYRCNDASGCPDVVAALERVAASLPDDPRCAAVPDVRVRVVIAPEPSLDSDIALAAWGYTYKASCVDEASMREFAAARYAKAPEDTCADGMPL
jgi:hypothetical protein